MISTAPPEFLKHPENQKVGLNGGVQLDCRVTGNPAPTMFWNREGSSELMVPGRTYRQTRIDESGTLYAEAVQKEDSGYFVCSAVSVAGSASSRALLQVRSLGGLVLV